MGSAESESRPTAVVVTIGDELLLGDRVDTNARWLARFLSDEGFRVRRILSVGDGEGEIRAALHSALEWVGSTGLVVTTGGLGPTDDDRTRPAVAELLNRPLREDPALLERLRTRFRERGVPDFPPTNRRIAQVPTGARLLENRVGSAPGLALEGSPGRLVLLPGVPTEMRQLAADSVRPLLSEWFPDHPDPPHRRILHTTGIPESALAGELEPILAGYPGVNLAYRPSVRGVELVFTAMGTRETDVASAGESDSAVSSDPTEQLERVLAQVAPLLESCWFEAPSGDLAEAVLQRLRERDWSVATAESCTAGLVAARLTDHPGSSDVVLGGVVAYSNRAKEDLLGVADRMIRDHGAVSAEVARAMAEGARDRFGSRLALGITGIAGPAGGSPAKPVGTVWFALASPDDTVMEEHRFAGDRGEIRERASQHALQLLHRVANPHIAKG